MGSYQYILLDWDGNLAKTTQIWLDSTIIVLKRNNYKHDKQLVLKGLSDLHSFFLELGVSNIQEVVDEIKLEVHRLVPKIELYPDAIYVLETLESLGKQLALITTSHRHLIFPVLKRFNLSNLFRVVITRDDVSKPKPHPEPLEKAIKQLGATKNKTIMIGDSAADLAAANSAGVDSILFFPPEHESFHDINKLKEHKPTYIVSDFRHIIEIIG